MYYNYTVEIPKDHVVKVKNKGVTYIYFEYDRTYIKEKKFNSAKRQSIGKQSKEDCNLMYPNEYYAKHFPGSEKPEEEQEPKRSCSLQVGTFIVIRKLVESLGLKEILSSFLDEKDLGLFLDFATYSIITEGNVAQYFDNYAYHHPLFSKDMKVYSDSTVSRFLKEMPEDAKTAFLDKWNEKHDHRKRIYISYDSTNKNSQAGDLDIVEYGHPKDDKGLPIFGYSIAYDSSNSVPLFYEQYPGSIIDMSQLEFMLSKANSYGYKGATFILDRGYFCKSNIRELESKNYHFIMMVKGLKPLVHDVIDSNRGKFESSRDCYIRSYETYGTTELRKLYADDEKERYIHVYHSVARVAAERLDLERQLNKMAEALDKAKNTKYDFPLSYHHYFDLIYSEDGKLMTYTEKSKTVEQELSYCGYFCIVTSEKMTAKEALEIYKSRDENEKLFRTDKSFLGNGSMRVHSEESTEAKILVEFVALIIRNKFFTYLKDSFNSSASKPNYATVPAAIRELEKIEMVRNYDGIYRLDHAVTRRQKDLLKCFGLDADQVKEISKMISKQLSQAEAK
jgi:transposase